MNSVSRSKCLSSKCLNCGVGLTGRADKKFCSPFCKTQFNNQKKAKEEEVVLKINQVLRKNRSILQSLHSAGHITTTSNALQQMGFNFGFYTHQLTERGIVCNLCYEWGYNVNFLGAVQLVSSKNE